MDKKSLFISLGILVLAIIGAFIFTKYDVIPDRWEGAFLDETSTASPTETSVDNFEAVAGAGKDEKDEKPEEKKPKEEATKKK